MERFEILTEYQSCHLYGGTSVSFWGKLLKFLLKFGDALLEGLLEGWKEAERESETSLTF